MKVQEQVQQTSSSLLAKLYPSERRVVECLAETGAPHKIIAFILKTTEANVREKLYRARLKLKCGNSLQLALKVRHEMEYLHIEREVERDFTPIELQLIKNVRIN